MILRGVDREAGPVKPASAGASCGSAMRPSGPGSELLLYFAALHAERGALNRRALLCCQAVKILLPCRWSSVLHGSDI